MDGFSKIALLLISLDIIQREVGGRPRAQGRPPPPHLVTLTSVSQIYMTQIHMTPHRKKTMSKARFSLNCFQILENAINLIRSYPFWRKIRHNLIAIFHNLIFCTLLSSHFASTLISQDTWSARDLTLIHIFNGWEFIQTYFQRIQRPVTSTLRWKAIVYLKCSQISHYPKSS